MKTVNPYLFTSKRLGFRNWKQEDLEPMSAINANPEAMEFFPSMISLKGTASFIHRMQAQFQEKAYCYFAVELLDTGGFIGFIGLSQQTFESDFTPCTDLGWRLHPDHWGKGYATEGASRCLDYAREELQLDELLAMAPKLNRRSIGVMERIGMSYIRDFRHPGIKKDHPLELCSLYGLIIK